MRPRVKKSPSIERGLGPLHASFIVRQVEQPLSASIPPLSLAVICRDCENAFPSPLSLLRDTFFEIYAPQQSRELFRDVVYIKVSRCKIGRSFVTLVVSILGFFRSSYFGYESRYANSRVRCMILLHNGVKINGTSPCMKINPFLE